MALQTFQKLQQNVTHVGLKAPRSFIQLFNCFLQNICNSANAKMFNNGQTFMLIVVEKFSNFAWAEPLKNKTVKSILKTFAKILNRGRLKTLFLYTDRGLEFANNLFQNSLF